MDSNNLISAIALTGFAPLVHKLGGAPDALLARVGLSPEALDHAEAMIPLDATIELLEIAATTLACPDFGMRLADERGDVPTMPQLQTLLRNSPTIRAMMRHATDHNHLYSPGVKIFLDDSPVAGGVVQRFDIVIEGPVRFGQFMEQTLLMVYRTVAFLSGGRLQPREIWFSHTRISPAHDYGRRFAGCEVRFGQEYDGVFFTLEDVALPITGRDDALFAAELRATQARFPARSQDIEAKLRETLQATIRHGLYSRADIARLMGISVSSLQRGLSRGGKSFEGIRDDVRRQLALRYLAREDLPLSEIAPKLGYAEMAVLSRSCRRWFGMTSAAKRGQLLRR